MSLNDPFFTKFDGSPDVGRVPVRLIVGGSGALTGSQLRGVEHAYEKFREAYRLSPADFHTEQVLLSDGTRVHLWSLQGRDEVTVTPADDGDGVRLPHGFVVATNWQTPLFYCRDLTDGVHWVIGGDPVLQIEALAGGIYDNQVFRKAGDAYFNLPHVFDSAGRTIWDYEQNGGLTGGPSGTTTPFRIKNTTTGELTFEPAHYAVQNTVLDVDATTLYTMADETPILSPLAPEYPDPVSYFPSATDAEGNQLAMNAWRFAVLSPTANIWKFRLWNERIRRVGDSTYAAVERNTIDLITPFGKQTTTITDVSDNLIGESLTPLYTFRWTSNVSYMGSGHPAGYPGTNTVWAVGWTGTADWMDVSPVGQSLYQDSTVRIIKEQGESTWSIQKVLVAPKETDAGYIDIEAKLNYPATVFWRGGEAGSYMYTGSIISYLGLGGYDPHLNPNSRVTGARIFRIDTDYSVAGTPQVIAKLGWKDLKLLDGTTTGTMTGKIYSNLLYKSASYDKEGIEFITKEYIYIGGADYAWLSANNDAAEYRADAAATTTTDFGGTAPTTVWEYPYNQRPANTMSYNLVSRYVIDYDHKGRFYSAIRCEVVCTGGEWEENTAIYEGFMQTKTNPTYAVKIWFESNWNGVEAQQLLVEETVTRPAFEAITHSMISPWYWRGYAYIDRDCKARMPPEPTPDENFMMQFKTLASHQGVNTHLCCADVRPDITGGDIALTQSVDGIEYSYLDNGTVIPHDKYVTGQLYARTFKLSDITESLWMLKQLKVNAKEGDFQPVDAPDRPEWYYHPVIKAALDVQRHIEVRDGVIVQWSDNIPGETSGYPPTPAAPPAATARSINLYRV